MQINIDISEFIDLVKQVDSVASIIEKGKINQKITERCLGITLPAVKNKFPESKDTSKSGRKGSRPGAHAADNIPVSKPVTKGSYTYIVIGWEKSDNSPYFYVEFLEWGTSMMKPYAMFDKTSKELDSQYSRIAEEEYQKLFDNTLGR